MFLNDDSEAYPEYDNNKKSLALFASGISKNNIRFRVGNDIANWGMSF